MSIYQLRIFLFSCFLAAWGSSSAIVLEPVIQKGHSSPILVMTTTLDGKYAVTGGAGRVLKIWELATGRELRTLVGHSGVITDVEITSDGRRILSTEELGPDHNGKHHIFVWDFASGELIKTIETSVAGGDIALSSNQLHVLTGDAKLIDIVSGKVIRSFYDGANITATAYSPMGDAISYGDNLGFVRVISIKNGQALATYKHEKSVSSLAFSSDGTKILSAGFDGKAILYDLDANQLVHQLNHSPASVETDYFPREVLDAVFGHNERWIFTSGKDKRLVAWDAKTGEEKKSIDTGYVIDNLALQRNPDYIVAASREIAIDQWNPISGRLMKSLQSKSAKEKKFVIDNTGRWLFSVSNRKNIAVWNLETGLIEWRWDAGVGDITDISVSNDNYLIVVTGEKKTIRVWDYEMGSIPDRFSAYDNDHFLVHDAPITGARFVKSDRYIISIAGDGEIAVWGDRKSKVDAHSVGEPLVSMAVSPDGEVLATGGYKGSVHVWDIADDGQLSIRMNLKHKDYVSTLEFSPDGNHLHTSSFGKVRTFDIAQRSIIKPSLPIDSPQYTSALSKNGGFLAVGAMVPPVYEKAMVTQTLKLWDIKKRSRVDFLPNYNRSIEAVRFHPFESRLYVAFDGGIDVIDLDSRELIATFTASSNGESTVVTPDGYFNSSIEGAGLVYLVDKERNESYALNQYESHLKRPAVIAARLRGVRPKENNDIKLSLPPNISLVNTPVSTEKGTKLAIYVAGESVVRDVKVYVNGNPVQKFIVGERESSLKIEVPYTYGDSRIAIYAFNEDGIASKPLFIDQSPPAGRREGGTLYLLTVGINKYKYLEEWELTQAVLDATNFAKAMKENMGNTFSNVVNVTLLDEMATRSNILDALKGMITLSSNDMAVVLVAGHGVKDKESETYYLLSHDTFDAESPSENDAIGWSDFKEVLEQTAARVMVFLDACHSASITNETVTANDKLASQLFSDQRSGHLIFSASKAGQESEENESIGGGLFTQTVIKAITDGRHDADYDQNGFVEYMEMVDYVQNVFEHAGEEQTPWLARREMFGDFPLVRVSD